MAPFLVEGVIVAVLSNYQGILALSSGSGVGDLSSVLATGNSTGANDILVSTVSFPGTSLRAEDNTAGDGGGLGIYGSNAGGGVFDGGDITLTPGTGSGGGADGSVVIDGPLVVTGPVSIPNLISGSGSPEGSVSAVISTLYQRTDGNAGNSLYIKMGGSGAIGWCPSGPTVLETFQSTGSSSFTTSRPVFEDPVGLGVQALTVYLGGLFQRLGGPGVGDFTVSYLPSGATVSFNDPLPSGDQVSISYLPV